MITTDLMHALAISVVLLAQTPETTWIIYAASLGQGTAAVIFRPAAQAHTPAVVGVGPLLSSANALGAFTTGVVGRRRVRRPSTARPELRTQGPERA
ncbi:hypothetical protein [Nonomuraea sp. CA-141351]|uniref:hypothetical protein n=1 Tax=Nonomuraea sp. CA-141351 TaxID=3239996 RepID=UPI003D93E146